MAIGGCIVLNNSYEFLSINEWYDAFCLVYTGKAKVLAEYPNQQIRSAHQALPAPAVIQLNHKAHVRRDRRQPFTLASHRNIWVRDKGKCAYCDTRVSMKAVTKDHVVPQCRGGRDTLENVVSACRDCNGRKGDKSLADCGMKLRADIELRHLTDDEKITVLFKTCSAEERKAWIGFLKRENLRLF